MRLADLVKEVAGSPKVIVDVAGRGEVEVDFTPPYRVISIPERLREAVHPLTLPDLNAHSASSLASSFLLFLLCGSSLS